MSINYISFLIKFSLTIASKCWSSSSLNAAKILIRFHVSLNPHAPRRLFSFVLVLDSSTSDHIQFSCLDNSNRRFSFKMESRMTAIWYWMLWGILWWNGCESRNFLFDSWWLEMKKISFKYFPIHWVNGITSVENLELFFFPSPIHCWTLAGMPWQLSLELKLETPSRRCWKSSASEFPSFHPYQLN